MKVIIAGGRNFNDYELLKAELNILIVPTISEQMLNNELMRGNGKNSTFISSTTNHIMIYKQPWRNRYREVYFELKNSIFA